MRKRPDHSTSLFAYWLQDVGGDWLLHADHRRRVLAREMRADRARGYKTTEIIAYTAGLRP